MCCTSTKPRRPRCRRRPSRRPSTVDWTATITPSIDSGLVRAVLGARGGDVVPLHADAQVLGEMIVVPQANGGTLAERERDAIHETLRQTDGRLAQAARRLGISRTTLWRRLRAERRSQKP